MISVNGDCPGCDTWDVFAVAGRSFDAADPYRSRWLGYVVAETRAGADAAVNLERHAAGSAVSACGSGSAGRSLAAPAKLPAAKQEPA